MRYFDYLPCYVLNHSPRIIAAFEMDFLRSLEAFQKAIPQGEKFTMLLQLGWSAELPEVAAELKSRLALYFCCLFGITQNAENQQTQ